MSRGNVSRCVSWIRFRSVPLPGIGIEAVVTRCGPARPPAGSTSNHPCTRLVGSANDGTKPMTKSNPDSVVLLRRVKTKRLVIGFVIGAGLLLPGYCLWSQYWSYDSTDISEISWTRGGVPYNLTFKVVDVQNRPIEGVSVDMEDESGGDVGVTNEQGVWIYRPDSGLLTCRVNGISVMKERAMQLGPSPDRHGLIVTIVLKEPGAFGIER